MSSPVESQQVSWWEVHEFVAAAVAQANIGPLPTAGTPSWRTLADGDPRKLLSLACAGEHHVLRMETAQTALAEASRDVSAAADWTAVAGEVARRREAYIPREVAS